MSEKKDSGLGFSRREFLKGMGTTAVATATSGARGLAQELEKVNQERAYGPGPVALTLRINGKSVAVEAAPNQTLLDVLRKHLSYTGAKEVCGGAACGACTVLLDGMPVYACSYLAIEAQGKAIHTVEGLSDGEALTPLQEAFVEEDGMQCGYCTSGLLMTLTAFLKDHPKPDAEAVRHAISGHICRCGTYPRVVQSALRAAGLPTESSTEVISWSHGEKLA
jgi:aerobic-type carbon monoxide dehydrogenase small subunit (CoxS/CutS family)